MILTNLFALPMGFALLSRHFEKSRVPLVLPRFLFSDWKGGFVLLVMVFVLSSFLDNIAAALIGGAMAHQLFRAQVHIGYLAAIVANVATNLWFREYSDAFPFIGFGVWVAIVISLPARRPDWEILPDTFKGTLFLLALVLSASMMPVESCRWPRGKARSA